MTKGTPASSQIIWLEQRVQELEAQLADLRKANSNLASAAIVPDGMVIFSERELQDMQTRLAEIEKQEPIGYVDDYASCGYFVANTPTNTYKTFKPVFKHPVAAPALTDDDFKAMRQAAESAAHQSKAEQWRRKV